MRIGFHAPFLHALGGGEKVLLTMLAEAAAAPGAEVELLSPPPAPDPAAWRRLGLEVPHDAFAWVAADDAEVSARSAGLDLLVALTNDVPPRSAARRSVAYVSFPVRPRDRPAERARALALALARRRRAPAALASYERFLVNSAFTREHVRRRLGVAAEILAPPVSGPASPPRPEAREPIVLAVGRFFRGAHDKRHDVLVRAAATLPEPWRLHLVGGVGREPGAGEHLAALGRQAAGLPVELHPDAPAGVLADLHARAALLWHAAGFGVDARRHPERCEHFGIAVAEAMLHGVVPLVVPCGGPGELVDDGVSGRHWWTADELAGRTLALVGDPAERARLAAGARAAAEPFAEARFRERVRRLLGLAG